MNPRASGPLVLCQMHVCHLCDTSVEGDYFRNIATGLARKGVRLSLVQLCDGDAPGWLSEIPSVTFRSLNANSKLQYPMAVRRLAGFLKSENVDILHTHLFFSGIIGVFAKRLNRKTIVALMRHHTSAVRMLGSRLHIKADKWMAEKADHVMTVSAAARGYMLDADGIGRDDIKVVYLGFDFKKLSENADDRTRVRLEFGFEADDFVIGYIGSFAPGKGQRQLIRAFGKISEEIPTARLFLVGRGMPPEIEIEVAKFPKDKIVFAGWRDDISACLNAMDLFVQPSLSEAFSQVLIEAMGVGIPVIATEVGGAKEVIEDSVNGILIAPNDPAQISEAVLKIYHDIKLREKIGAAGRQNVRDRFTADRMVERHMELYERWLRNE